MSLTFFVLAVALGLGASSELAAEYRDPRDAAEIQHLVRDPGSGRIFIGATNAVLSLDKDLRLLARHETGPRLDSPFCSFDGRDCIKPLSGVYQNERTRKSQRRELDAATNSSRVSTPNVNQVLALHPDGRRLLVCGSLFQGMCSLHDLADISRTSVGPSEAAGQIAVAANSPNASTTAFVGPGPGRKRGSRESVLYVGATYTHPFYRDTFPSVATRSLAEKTLLQLVDEGDVSGRSAMEIRAEYRADFKVRYVSGFAADGFVFWATVQPSSPTRRNSPSVTKLLRICDSDLRYESYAELGLECLGEDNSKYNLLQAVHLTRLPAKYLSTPAEEHQLFLVAVFAKGSSIWSPGRRSAVCMFPLRAVQEGFVKNAQRCNSGVGRRNLPHFGSDQKCHNVSKFGLPGGDCAPSRIGGVIAETKMALHIFNDALLTSVTSTEVGGQAVLFFGTSDGRLKKMVLEALDSGREFGELAISKSRQPIGRDLVIDEQHLYATAGNTVMKVSLASCGAHAECGSCVQSADPFCGWCSLEARCSGRAECRDAALPDAWIPANAAASSPDDAGRCPKLISLKPANLSLSAPIATPLTIKLNSLPPPGKQDIYQCVFGDGNYVRARYSGAGTLSCELPPFAARPSVPSGRDHVAVPLRIWSGRTTQVFFETAFTFYDCEAHNLCTSCVGSDWGCDWCLLDNRCVHQPALCTNQTRTRGVSECPHIDAGTLAGHEVRLPSGLPSPIRLPVANLGRLLSGRGAAAAGLSGSVECSVEVPSASGARPSVVRSEGELGDDGWVTCAARTYVYHSHAPKATATLFLSAGGSTLIDKTTVELYKCNLLAKDCSRCLSLEPAYGCTWCGGGCHFRAQCPFGTAPEEDDPLTVCPAPTILSISPPSGPVEGGTRVTIRGRDLGTSIGDVAKRVLIAGRVQCDVVDYKPSTKIVCVTQATDAETSGPVSVSIGAGSKEGSSHSSFAFVRPALHSFSPNFGPMSGGTSVRVLGAHLDAGSHVEVALLGAGSLRLACEVDAESVSSGELLCRTRGVPHPGFITQRLELCVDWANRTLAREFRYTPDPVVTSVSPLSAFRSGGRRLTVKGRHLNVTMQPLIFLIDPVKRRESSATVDADALPPLASEYGACEAVDESTMICQSPSMLNAKQRGKRSVPYQVEDDGREERAVALDASRYESWPIGFKMDGVASVLSVEGMELRVVPDPELRPFPGGRKLYREEGDPLILEGRDLALGSDAADVRVFVGADECNVTLLAPSQLVCEPPREQPESTDAGALPLVTVVVGNLRMELGRLAYASSGISERALSGFFSSPAVVGGLVTAAASVLLCLVVAVAIWWRRKSCQAEKEYKRIQLQMDSLESNVRMECKQAFAELQTDMSDLTSDLLALGIPFNSRRVYAAKILFKESQQQHLLLDWDQHAGYSVHLQAALAQFESLLWSREFVVGFVEGLEAEPTFSSSDRVYVASLLTAALARNMEFLTDVVLELLRRLIARNVHSRAPPQLMLRQTGSVVEKMLSNWISLCLYDHMQEEAGSSLFLLLKALKHQVEKGPVDAVTADARYSLSEDRLLREQIKSEPLTLKVVQSGGTGRSRQEMSGAQFGDDGSSSVTCRVLSCDTVSQAKGKILDTLFRNHPFSSRPALCDIDLEWLSPRGPITLLDDERCGASPPLNGRSDIGGLKRLNTLATYRLHEGVPGSPIIVTLVARDGRSSRQAPTSFLPHHGSHYASVSSSSLLIPNGHHSPESWDSGASSGSSAAVSRSSTRYWHLVPPGPFSAGSDSGTSTLASRRERQDAHSAATLPKSIPEIYLTRLLTSKGTVQKFVDDFFTAALRVQGPSFPIVIKYLFDFLEAEAKTHNIEDPSVVHAWKNNALSLRFWVNVMKNPEFVFDVEKTGTVDSALSVVAAAFMDACSPSAPRLGKDSPSNKLLFAKDLPRYRDWVSDFYRRVRLLPPVTAPELGAHLAALSKAYAGEFSVLGTVRELLCYAVKYQDGLTAHLDAFPHTQGHRLRERLQGVLGAMSGNYMPPDEHVYASVN